MELRTRRGSRQGYHSTHELPQVLFLCLYPLRAALERPAHASGRCVLKRSGSDYWPLYHDDFWDDPIVLAMGEREQLAYLFLLGLQWKHGGLPASDKALSVMCSRFYAWPKLWRSLAHLFPKCEQSGLRVNARLRFEASEVDAKRLGSSSRKARWRAQKRGLSQECPMGQVQGVPPLRRGEEKRGEETSPSEKADRAPRATPRKLATGPEAEVVRAFEAVFLERLGTAYQHQGAKDGAAVKALLGFTAGDPAKVVERIPVFFADAWRRERASLAMFRAKWNECVPKAAPAAPQLFEDTDQGRAAIERVKRQEALQRVEIDARRAGVA